MFLLVKSIMAILSILKYVEHVHLKHVHAHVLCRNMYSTFTCIITIHFIFINEKITMF